MWLAEGEVPFATDLAARAPGHLITEDAGRKLFDIEQMEEGLLLVVRLVTKGAWTVASTGELNHRTGSTGHTVWRLKSGKIHPVHCETIGVAVEACLQK